MNDQELLNAIRAIVREEIGKGTQPLTHIERKLTYLVDERTAASGANFANVKNMTAARAEEIGVDLPALEVVESPGVSGIAAARAALRPDGEVTA